MFVRKRRMLQLAGRSRLRQAAVVGGLAVGLLLAACGGSEAEEPLALSDYLALCAAEEAVEEGGTWREFGADMAATISDMQNVAPPVALEGYHAVTLQAGQLILNVVREQNQDAPAVPFALFGVALLANGMIDSTVEALPADLRSQLVAADCWEESDWDVSA